MSFQVDLVWWLFLQVELTLAVRFVLSWLVIVEWSPFEVRSITSAENVLAFAFQAFGFGLVALQPLLLTSQAPFT